MGDLPDWMMRVHARASRPGADLRDPALTAAQTMQRPRPMPRQMRPAAARASDPNPGVRRQATREMEMRQAFNPQQEAYAPPRNQFAEAGGMALEATGLPSIRRGTANVARGAINADPMQGLRQTGAGALELGMGGLGVASLGVGARGARPAPRAPQATPEPMPRMTPPPREIAPNGMTIRPPAPFRQSFVGGSDDLADAARRPQLWRGSDTAGSRGGWATPDRQAASEYGANVRPASGDASNALEVRDFGDIELAIGDDPAAQRALGYLNDGNADVWDALELPEVQAALRARGHGAVKLAADVSPTGRRHESVLFLRGRPPGIAPRTGGERLNWLGNDRLIRNPTEADLTRLSELGDEMKYVMDTDGNVYAFSAADAHHNTAMRALRDNGVQVRSLGPGAEVTDPDAAGFIWRNKDGSFAHENANMVESGPYSNFAQRVRPNGQATRAPGIAPQQAPPRTSPRLFPSPNTPRTRPQAPAGTGDMQPRGVFGDAPSRIAYRGLNRPYNPNDGGYYQAFTSSLDDAREYGPNVMAANLQLGRNLAIDGGGNNFNALSVDQLPAEVRARLHPSIDASATTDQIAHAAREAGYDSVTVRNVHDNRWGERHVRGSEPRTIDFVFDARNISPLDSIPEQKSAPRAPQGRTRLSDADRALLDELERDLK